MAEERSAQRDVLMQRQGVYCDSGVPLLLLGSRSEEIQSSIFPKLELRLLPFCLLLDCFHKLYNNLGLNT